MARINMKGFVKVNMDATPYVEAYNADIYHTDKELQNNYWFRAMNPVIYFNGTAAYYPDRKNPEKIGHSVPDHLMTEAIRSDLQAAWANR